MQSKNVLKKGNKVIWCGHFGDDVPKVARVKAVQVTDGKGKDTGSTVESVSWDACSGRRVVVSLTNKRWAYGYQLEPWRPFWIIKEIICMLKIRYCIKEFLSQSTR